ncbi:hypothetical protein BC628DRAFT_1396068 [Trametes gibbosa]|nr:hypothetical protein BC628DRAFT_1396068 [Trametes gibbosa]
MLLAPSADPPSPSAPAKSTSALQNSTSHNIPSASPSPNHQVFKENGEVVKAEETGLLDHITVPTVILDAPSVTHTMAARLSLSLLGHTLFLKSQVPFPVAQLLRMPCGASSPKVAKKREELLATFDTLSSHLQTTFVALSTALAKCKSAKDKEITVTGDENSQTVSHASATASAPQKGTAHLMFILGPSVGAARARVLLTVDGLEIKVWGERVDHQDLDESEGAASIDLEKTDDEDSYEVDDEDPEDDSEECEDEGSAAYSDEEASRDGDGSDGLENDRESDSASLPPASRSPSPSPLARSRAPSPESISSPQPSTCSLPTPMQQPPTSSPPSTPAPAPITTTGSASRQPSPSASRRPAAVTQTYAEEQATLRAAERLLSRTLMTAWADGGGDMASELAPTQTHVYLRAPRRFAHPAWIARQNLARSLDGILDAFLVDAGARRVKEARSKKTRGVKTEGVWISCKGGSAFATAAAPIERAQEPKVLECEEADEEIWWAWEGKIIGFADW